MHLVDLLSDVVERLPEDRRRVMESMVEEYALGENLRFLVALVAGASRNERRLLRQFLNDLDRMEFEEQGET